MVRQRAGVHQTRGGHGSSPVARKLGERSRLRHTVPQESEIDAEKRPDVRVENPKTGPVSIEVKWAENWSLADLLERLENQLISEYLRAHNSRHGIYFLAIDGRDGDRQWKTKDGKLVPFREVERILRERAREIVATRIDVESLEICTIDFRHR